MFGIKRKSSERERVERLDALGATIAKKRDEAVAARKESGIEDIWHKCEESYLGIDDANRHEFAGAKWTKSRAIDGPISTNDTQQDSTRSTAFVRLTSRYVDFAASKMCEIALPIDDKAFSFEPTPVPDLVNKAQDETPVASIGPDGQPVQAMVKDVVAQMLAQAKDSAKRAETRIYDWMVECRHTAEMRKVIHDSARVGVGVLKGPVPDKRKSQAIMLKDNVVELKIEEKTVPVTGWVDYKNLFPAASCGEDINDGDHIFERIYNSAKRLRELSRMKGWNKKKIEQVLVEGPGKCYMDGHQNEEKGKRQRFEMWQFYGTLSRDELYAAGVDNLPEDVDEAYAIVTLVNDSIVRCILNPLDSGKFPYHVFSWSRRAGHWNGVGVAEQVSMPQRMVNASTRAVLENAGISAGIQIVMDRGLVVPADQQWSITRNKIWWKSADAVLDDVRKAFHIFEIPNLTAQLMPIIEYALRLAEEHSSIPMVSQGQYAANSPQTFGQADLQNTNALSFLRERGNMLDDAITEPLVLMFYEWLLLDPDVPIEEKGDFQINAHGTSAMVEKAIQEVTITQALNLSLNPAFGADPEKVYAMWLKNKRIDPRDAQLDEEKKQAAQNRPQPKAPQVEAAEIRANVELQKEDMRTKAAVEKMRMDTDRDNVYVQEMRHRTETEAALQIQELNIRRELAQLEYANRNQISLDELKTQMARDAMKIQATERLAAMEVPSRLLPTAPVEPPGQARPGHSYTE